MKKVTITLLITFLVACATAPQSDVPAAPHSDLPVYNGAQDIKIDDDLTVNIGKAYWRETVGFEKPAATFLIVEVSVTNVGKKSTTIHPPVFTVVNDQGYEYELSRSAAELGETFFYETLLNRHQNRLPPLIPVRGYIVFDVPHGDYTLIVSRGGQDAGGGLIRLKDVARYKLTAIDK